MNKAKWIAHCLTFPGSYEDYPFDENWAVMRHRGSGKSFAMIYEREGQLSINLKCEPLRADLLRAAFPQVQPGYHMNKTHWNTVLLDGGLPESELFSMIAHSFELTRPTIKRRKS